MRAEPVPSTTGAQGGVRPYADRGWLVSRHGVTSAKPLIKQLAAAVGLLRAGPHLIGYAIGRRLLGRQRAFTAASERIARLAGFAGLYARQAFYRRTLRGVGRDVFFGFSSLLSKCDTVIGDRVYIGRFCIIGLAEIGDDVMLADGVQVLSGRHQHGRSAGGGLWRDNEQVFTKVTIGRGAGVGAGAIVMADVGERAVVGAGAVVVKPVPAGASVAGVPAVPIESSRRLADEP